jgi:hypothetical protein
MARSLARNTRMFATTLDVSGEAGGDALTSCVPENTFEIKVLDGYTFSQDVATQEVGVNESDSACTAAGSGLARGTLSFNTALNPVDVSFSTYVRPYQNDEQVDGGDDGSTDDWADCVERILWGSAMGSTTSWDATAADSAVASTSHFVQAQDDASIKFGLGASNVNSLMDLTLFFVLEQTTYKILNFNVATAEVDFSIDGIATINWSGQGSRVLEDEASHAFINNTSNWVAGTDYQEVPETTTTSFLRNKLSVLEVSDNEIYGFDPTATGDETDGVASISTVTVNLDGSIAASPAYVGGIIYNSTQNEWAFIHSHDTTSVDVSDRYADLVADWTSSDAVEIYAPAQDDLDTFGSVSGAVITLGTSTITDAVYANGRVLNLDSGEWATILSNNTTTVTVVSADVDLVTGWAASDPLAFYTKDQHAGTIFCIPITGATLTLENNTTYLTPEELAIVNLPLAGFAGNRVTSGSFTAYLNTGAQGSGGLLQDMLEKIQDSVSNSYHIRFSMGNGLTATPRVEFDIRYANLSVPTTNVEDLITTEITFSAKPWNVTNNEASFEDTNEMTIEYFKV